MSSLLSPDVLSVEALMDIGAMALSLCCAGGARAMVTALCVSTLDV